MTDEPARPLTTGEVAARFGVHSSTVIEWADTGKLPYFRTPGGHRRFNRADVDVMVTAEPSDVTA